jgi:hypothetical protein
MLFVGDDWAEDHHDLEVQDETGRVLVKARVPEGVAGVARLHALVGDYLTDQDTTTVHIAIETDRGPWVQALVSAGYRIYAINPLQVARSRSRHGLSGGKSDTGDAHVLAEMMRLERNQLRLIAGDSVHAEATKVLSRAHKTLIWERARHLLRLRHALRDFFPAALVAFDDLTAPDALELLALAPDPVAAARLSIQRISAALRRANRRQVQLKAARIKTALHAEHLGQPAAVTAAFAALVRAQVAILTTLNTEITTMERELATQFGQHPDADIYLSQPGLGVILGARVLAEFGDDKNRYANAKARRNYAGTSPITRQSGKKKTVLARYVHNNRLLDALSRQAFAALTSSPGARAYYDQLRGRGTSHYPALRQLGNRLVGILHGCLKKNVKYDENIAWTHHQTLDAAAT